MRKRTPRSVLRKEFSEDPYEALSKAMLERDAALSELEALRDTVEGMPGYVGGLLVNRAAVLQLLDDPNQKEG